MTMDQQIKGQWLKALRSGQYEQGTKMLRYQQYGSEKWYYCCLGVLCDVVEPNEWLRTTHRQQAGLPALEFVEYVCQIDYETAEKLAAMNDAGEKFEAIADYIEKNL